MSLNPRASKVNDVLDGVNALDADLQDDEVVEGETEEEGEGGEEQVSELHERLARLEGDKGALALLSDPEVRALLKARAEGKSAKVVVEDLVGEKDGKGEGDDVDDTDPATRLEQRLAALEALAVELQGREVADQVKSAQTKFPDLKEYREKMVELSRGFPGLKVEELYVLAKHRAGKLTAPSTFTEKPSVTPRRRDRNDKRAATPHGRKAFSERLQKALENLDFRSE